MHHAELMAAFLGILVAGFHRSERKPLQPIARLLPECSGLAHTR
jgi:hypothetical protein